MKPPIVTLNDISFSYHERVLEDVSFSVGQSELCALVGPNGSGKSTLIKCILGLLEPDHGTITFAETLNPQRDIAYVEQRHDFLSNLPVSVYEVVSSGRTAGAHRWWRHTKKDREIIEHSIEAVGLLDKMHSPIDELSGGQQQRVLIAKAFASEPTLLILDEPIAGVDASSQKLFRDSLHHIISEHSTSVLLVSHELSAVSDIVDHIVVLKGSIVFDDTADALRNDGVSLGIHEHDLPMWLEHLHTEEKS